MAKDHFVDYDTTAGNNTDVDGVDTGEGTAPSNVNDAMREMMADAAEFYKDTGGGINSAGAGGAYTLTTNDSVAAYVQGQMYAFEANHAVPDTSTVSLNVNAIGAKPLRKRVSTALSANDIKANEIVIVAYEATNDIFQVIAPYEKTEVLPSASGVLALHKNLIVENNAGAAVSQVDIDADEVVVTDGTEFKVLASINLTADITASGANGLDTGAEATSTWYHLWVIAKEDGTAASLISASATAPTMPATYLYKGYVGAIFNDAGDDFLSIYQLDRNVSIEETADLANGSAVSYTSVTMTVPSTARIWTGYTTVTNTSGGTVDAEVVVAPTNNADNRGKRSLLHADLAASQNTGAGPYECMIIEAQTLYYLVNNGVLDLDLNTTGWKY